MRRGYFDDFTDLKETGGRMFPVAEGLAPASTAPAFPVFVVCMSRVTLLFISTHVLMLQPTQAMASCVC